MPYRFRGAKGPLSLTDLFAERPLAQQQADEASAEVVSGTRS